MAGGLERPLAGVRVVSVEQAVAMPYASWLLAEMGADVIKVERPGRGDVIRGWDGAVRGLSTGFVWLNGGKRDVALDLSRDEGHAAVHRLLEGADVFLENLAPGAADRLSLGYAELRAAHPRLVCCSLSGYGQTGPFADRKAYDLLVQGEAGLILANGYPEAPAKIGLPITDLVAGTNAALGVVLALRQREHTGAGSYVDVSMFDSIVSWLGYYPQHHWASGAEPPRLGMRHQYLVPYGPYLAADGRYVNLVVANDDDWGRFCRDVVRRPEWIDHPRFATVALRTQHRAELDELVESAIVAQPADHWCARLDAAGLGFGAVRTMREVMAHPQLEARDMVVHGSSPVGPVRLVRFALAPPDQPRHVPDLGEHTDEILGEAGYSPSEIAGLRRSEVVE